MRILRANLLFCVVVMTSMLGGAQRDAKIDVHMRLAFPAQAKHHAPPAVMWLKPLQQTPSAPFPPHGHYTLLQKNRTFIPHLLVVPVGGVVLFPNADPFFHSVFSLFEGKRFDLGLYEAGSTKDVTFSREGVSYIFCNIHPEMSAVVLALSTPLYAIADASSTFQLHGVPSGEYDLHVWIEGMPQQDLDKLIRRVHLAPDASDLGVVNITEVPRLPATHLNKFGQPYDRDSQPTY